VRLGRQGHVGYRKSKAQTAEAELEGPVSAVEMALTASDRSRKLGEFDAVDQPKEQPLRRWMH
jgi:hypothetical protein